LKPAAPGTGIVAGSSVRQIVEVAGISDILGKILGSNNKITNSYATVKALTSLRNTRL
jgi:small subunit ribosomal protein S5